MGVDAHYSPKPDQGEDLVRQPFDGYSTVRFGPGTRDNVGELDKFCNFPRAVYGLSLIAV